MVHDNDTSHTPPNAQGNPKTPDLNRNALIAYFRLWGPMICGYNRERW